MYQIKFLKTPTLSKNRSLQLRRPPKNADLIYELSTTLTITNDLGERFFFGSTPLTLQVRYHVQNDPVKVASGFKVIGETDVQWEAGLMAVNGKIQLRFGEAPMGGYITMYVYIKSPDKVQDDLNYEPCETQALVKDTLKEKLSYFDDVKVTEYSTYDKLVFLPTVSDFIKVPKSIEDLPVKCERLAIRFIEKTMLYEELSGTIARHLWDAGIFLNVLPVDEMLKFTGFEPEAKMNILELGTGIGLASIHLSTIFKKAQILATDLDDAKDICESNIKLNKMTSNVKFGELDWESPVKTKHQIWDVILVTDCIYNPIYYDWLINVMTVEATKDTRVFFLHKFREPVSESEFFPKVRKHFIMEKQQWVQLNDGILVHMGMYSKK